MDAIYAAKSYDRSPTRNKSLQFDGASKRSPSQTPETRQKRRQELSLKDSLWEARKRIEAQRQDHKVLAAAPNIFSSDSLQASQKAFDFILRSTRCSPTIALCALRQTKGRVEDAITLILSKDFFE